MYTTFGQYLRDLRLSRGFSIQKLADRVGISAGYLGDVERGHRFPLQEKWLIPIGAALLLTHEEFTQLKVLSNTCRRNLPPDVLGYLFNESGAIAFIRSQIGEG